MALDEPRDNDVTFTEHGITFVMDRALFEEARPIDIDFITQINGYGFKFSSSLPQGGGCC